MSAPELIRIRTLRGPNVHAPWPALEATLRAGPAAVDDLVRATVQLQQVCGAKAGSARVIEGPEPGTLVAAIEIEDEELARRCLSAVLGAPRTPHGIRVPAAEQASLRAFAGDILLGPNTRALAAAARRRGIPVRRLGRGSLLILGHGARQRRLCGARTDRTSAIGEMIGWEKPLAKELLRAVGIPVPEGRLVHDAGEALAVAAAMGGPVVVKPESANHGRSVFIGLTQPEQIRAAYEAACREGETRGAVVERYIPGAEHRVLVVAGRAVAALRGDPVYACGDGRRSIRELIDEINLDPARAPEPDAPLWPVELDPMVRMTLQSQGYTPESVPPAGARVLIQRNGNLRQDVTADVHPANAGLCALAAEAVGLDIAGIDLIVEDIARPIREQGGAVLEVNPMPGFAMHAGQPVADLIVREAYPEGRNGRIPIAVVCGGPEAAAAARRIQSALAGRGLVAGLACSDGAFVGADLTVAGNRATSQAAADLLLHPRIQAAVFETPESAVFEEGLAFDRCDALVVTGASSLTPALRTLLQSVGPFGSAFVPEQAPWANDARQSFGSKVILYAPDPAGQAADILAAVASP